VSLPRLEQSFVTGSAPTASGNLPRVSADLTLGDHWGTFKARWGVGRMDYRVDPGLYALGEPDFDSEVLVTANYKLSFDALRSALPCRDSWILVVDTDGINVWCAAGKGTFSTEELVSRIESSGLTRIVSHRRLIVPQLAAPGVAAHTVRELSGFRIKYGPIRAKDLPAFIDQGFKATSEMRLKAFPAIERVVLIPVELVEAMKYAVVLVPLFFLLGGLIGQADFGENVRSHGFFAALAMLSAVFGGTVLTPILLPWLPGRAFALKGAVAGLLVSGVPAVLTFALLGRWPTLPDFGAWIFIMIAVAAFLGMNFTGASTYTSLSGVRKEMRWAVPLEITSACIGLVLWFGSSWIV
jgi:hypothetical protein